MTTSEDKLIASLSGKKATTLNAEQRTILLVKQLEKQKRSTLADFTFGKIQSWSDYTKSSGFAPPAELVSQAVTYALIKQAFDIHISAAKAGVETLQLPPAKPTVIEQPKVDDNKKPGKLLELDDEFTAIDCLRNNKYGVIYDKHQEKATAELLRAVIRDRKRGVGLNSKVGSGKTFILGAFIKELWERQWEPLMKSISPYPLIYITRATVVEQTERVLFKQFGLRPGHQVDVTNIDQIRSKFGEQFIKEHIIVENGVEYITYKWHPLMAPVVIILDESQAVKNIDSTQSRMMQAYNDLEGDYFTVHASATMFTRVIESKVLAVATKLQW